MFRFRRRADKPSSRDSGTPHWGWKDEELEAASQRNVEAYDGLRAAILDLIAARNETNVKEREK